MIVDVCARELLGSRNEEGGALLREVINVQ
jgi:hypothetical protein